MFENVYINDNDEGYDNWLKSDEGIYNKNDLEGSRKKAIKEQSLMKKEELQEVGGSYDAFSKLKCFDVKESHNNSIFAYDVEEEYEKNRSLIVFRNINNLWPKKMKRINQSD